MKRISVKLTLLIFTIIALSSFISFIMSAIFGYNFKREIRINQMAMKATVEKMIDDYDLSPQDVDNIFTYTVFILTHDKDPDQLGIQEPITKIIDQEGYYYNQGKWHNLPSTVFRVKDYYFKISFDNEASLLKTISSRVGFTALSHVFFGTLLTILIVGKMVKPITKLSQATKEVAKGNFDVYVESRGQDEIKLLTDNFNKMSYELKQIEVLRKDFITNFSHEFKTPLASIQGFAKLLSQDTLTQEEQREYAEIIVEETDRMSHLASNILKLTKLENQDQLTDTSLFSLDEQIRHSILLFEQEWSEKKLNLRVDLDKIMIQGDQALLSQVWVNLMENAVKFSGPGQTIYVFSKLKDDRVEIHLLDEGIGMTSRTQKRIFEKFYQGDVNHSGAGNGLGLSIVKKIVSLHQGDIQVVSQVNQGTEFIISLPHRG